MPSRCGCFSGPHLGDLPFLLCIRVLILGTTDIWVGQVLRGCPVCCGLFNSIPGPYPFDDSRTHQSQQSECLSTLSNVPWGENCSQLRLCIHTLLGSRVPDPSPLQPQASPSSLLSPRGHLPAGYCSVGNWRHGLPPGHLPNALATSGPHPPPEPLPPPRVHGPWV